MTMRPTQDRVVIKVSPQPKKSEGGIILTEPSKEDSKYGRIISVGPGRTENGIRIPVRLLQGQYVLFCDYHTTNCGEKDIVIVDEEDVLAVIEE